MGHRDLVDEVCQKCGIIGLDNPNMRRTVYLVSKLRQAGKINYTGEAATRRVCLLILVMLSHSRGWLLSVHRLAGEEPTSDIEVVELNVELRFGETGCRSA
jgi:hypothetical protein